MPQRPVRMNRKSLIAAISVLSAMLVGIAVLMFILFGGSGGGKSIFSFRQDPLICAVPSNAVAVVSFDKLLVASGNVFSKNPDSSNGRKQSFEKTLADSVLAGAFPSMSRNPLVVSYHYARNITPLYIFDAGSAADSDLDSEISKMTAMASAAGYVCKDCDCSTILSVNESLRKRRILLVSPSVNVINSSLRHLNDAVSIYDSQGFSAAAAVSSGDNRLYFNVNSTDQLARAVVNTKYCRTVGKLSGFADWATFSLEFGESSAKLTGTVVSDMDTDLVRVFSGLKASSSSVFGILPSGTKWALSLPLDSVDDLLEAYDHYLDGSMKLSDVRYERNALKKSLGESPLDCMKTLKPSEIAVAHFPFRDSLASVNLIRLGRQRGLDTLYRDYPYSGVLKSLLGSTFDRGKEKYARIYDGWMISGDSLAVKEYIRSLSYTLEQKLDDASLSGEIPSSAVLVAYMSADAGPYSPFSTSWRKAVGKSLEGVDMMPAILCLDPVRKSMPEISLSLYAAKLQRTQAPDAEAPVKLQLPSGPFTVKNSDTGRNNLFVQNKNLSLSLKEESGKGIWTIPFKTPICGSVVNVDMYGNGRLQFLFASGSRIYILDRKGRYVNPYPVDLGREILLGPLVQKENGKYVLTILHKDNSIARYSLDGKPDPRWLGIKPSEPVVAMPERMVSGDSSCWIVRTSRQTLIYPANGGDPLSRFKGNAIFRADAQVSDEGDGVVSAQSYDGKVRKVRI